MKKIFLILFTLGVMPASAKSLQEMINTSQNYVKQYTLKLKEELQSSLKSEGAVAAISHCKSAVPDIARDLNENERWYIGRTSLKVRYPENKADDWEKAVLMRFEKLKKQGEPVDTIQHHQIVEENDRKFFRYMKAIVTQPVCLTCHGEKIAGPVADEIEQLYPKDQATGFKIGDIRGAFTVRYELE